jgi:hypothetical protein
MTYFIDENDPNLPPDILALTDDQRKSYTIGFNEIYAEIENEVGINPVEIADDLGRSAVYMFDNFGVIGQPYFSEV